MRRRIVVIAHDMRSCHNVGALMRSAEGLGVERLYLTGYTPYPKIRNDSRLPYISQKISRQINKTALGAEKTLSWQHGSDIYGVLEKLNSDGFRLVALEQSKKSKPLNKYTPPDKIALLLGREIEGISRELLIECEDVLEIPMFGHKESLNVTEAASIALYHLRFAA